MMELKTFSVILWLQMKLRFLDFVKNNRIPSNLDKSEIEMIHQKQDSAF